MAGNPITVRATRRLASTPESSPGLSRRSGSGELFVLIGLASFIAPFMSAALNLAVPAIGLELGVSAVAVSWIVTSYLIATAALLLPFGRLGDALGRGRIFLAGVAVFTLASLACAVSHSFVALLAWRVAQAAGSAMLFGTSLAILVARVPAARRGRAVGINTAAVYIGLSAGPVIGGVLVQRFGWRSVFVVCVVLGVLAVIGGVRVLGVREAGAGGRAFAAPDALLYTAGVAAFVTGAATLRTWVPASGVMAGGAVALAGFAWLQGRRRDPLLDLRLFRDATFAFSNLAALLNYAATFAASFLLSLYLQVVRGLPPRQAGVVLLIQPVLMALISPLSGRLADRVEPRVLASAGMLVCAAGLVFCASFGPATTADAARTTIISAAKVTINRFIVQTSIVEDFRLLFELPMPVSCPGRKRFSREEHEALASRGIFARRARETG